MYQCNLDAQGNGYIVIRPDLSGTWRQAMYGVAFMAALPLIIALGFASVGLWLVLPFAGIEVLVLFLGSWWVRKRCCVQEVLYFEEHQITLERGVDGPKFRWSRARVWVQVHYQQAVYRGHPNRLWLGYQRERFEIGRYLTNEERDAVFAELANLVRVLRYAH